MISFQNNLRLSTEVWSNWHYALLFRKKTSTTETRHWIQEILWFLVNKLQFAKSWVRVILQMFCFGEANSLASQKFWWSCNPGFLWNATLNVVILGSFLVPMLGYRHSSCCNPGFLMLGYRHSSCCNPGFLMLGYRHW